MRKVNYKSDFDFILRLHDCKGEVTGWPEYDWVARIWTASRMSAYEASCIGGVCRNCRNDNGQIRIYCDDHGLSAGDLQMEFTAILPADEYPDSDRRTVRQCDLDIRLVRDGGTCPTDAEVELMLPYIKGEPFTYADFTPEQIVELQRPATEAANQLETFEAETTRRLDDAENERATAESRRATAERNRVTAEDNRVANEKTRVSAEAERAEAETKRQTAETARVEAEQARATAEADREEAERKREEVVESYGAMLDTKADRSELSNVYGEEMLTPDTFPEIETLTRDQLREDTFIDLFNAAARFGGYGKYDPENAPDPQHPYYLNRIWLTYAEAVTVMAHFRADYNQDEAYARTSARTNMPCNTQWSGTYNRFAQQAASLETAVIPHVQVAGLAQAFYLCTKLHTCEIQGMVSVTSVEGMFAGCAKLTNLRMKGLARNLSLASSPLITAESLRYLCENRGSGSAFTVTLHPDTYANLHGDGEEWQGLVELAAEKNITFATA